MDAYHGRQVHDKPLAVSGLTSYRYKGRYGWIMIGARDNDDALREAARSTNDEINPALLEVWSDEPGMNGDEYVNAGAK